MKNLTDTLEKTRSMEALRERRDAAVGTSSAAMCIIDYCPR